MRNQKGFTLTELLAIILIIGIIVTISISGINGVAKQIKTNLLCTKVTTIENLAVTWGQDYYNSLPVYSPSGTPLTLTLQVLVDGDPGSWPDYRYGSGGYLKKDDVQGGRVINPVDNTDMNKMKIDVYIKNNRVIASINASEKINGSKLIEICCKEYKLEGNYVKCKK